MTSWYGTRCSWPGCHYLARWRVELAPWQLITYRCGRHLRNCRILAWHDPA